MAFRQTLLLILNRFPFCALFCAGLLLLGAACAEKQTAILWTSEPEFVLYAQDYNTAQQQYRIEVHYVQSPLRREIRRQNTPPDIIIDNALNYAEALHEFANLDYLLAKQIDRNAFYPALLKSGQAKNKQYLLPVSFNLPVIMLDTGTSPSLPDQFTIDIDVIKEEGIRYNTQSSRLFTRIGFSPLWDKENSFIYLTAQLFGANFQEKTRGKTSDVIWNETALQTALTYLTDWVNESSGSIQTEDDFLYQYFFDPPHKLVTNGRILFAYSDSASFFKLRPEDSAALDFRWLSRENQVPVLDSIVSFGIYKKAKAKKAASDFARWFFSEQTQDTLLKKSRAYHLSGAIFGIANGLSAMQTVTENVFPRYYPGLLGRTPPPAALESAGSLPVNWKKIKEEVILPYLLSAIHDPQNTTRTLRERLTDWQMIEQGQF